jgi:hypothetical protein
MSVSSIKEREHERKLDSSMSGVEQAFLRENQRDHGI